MAIASSAAAMLAWGASAPAATDTWTGGDSSSPTNYNDPANWNTDTVPGASDIAYFNTGQSNQTPTLTTSSTVGELDFATSGWMLGGNPNVLTINGVGGVGILSTATSGINEISAPITLGAGQNWYVATGGTLQIDGILAGTTSDPLSLGSSTYGGTVLFTNANTYSGGIALNGGTLELGGTTISGTTQWGSLTSVPAFNLNAGTFLINNTNTNGGAGNMNNRLSSSATINFAGGAQLVYQGATNQTSTEQAGVVNLNIGPINVFQVNGNDGPGSATFTVSSINQFNYYAGYSLPPMLAGTMLVNGTNLGNSAASGNSSSIIVGTQPSNTTGFTNGASSESPTLLGQQVVSFLLGEISTGVSGAPAAAGVGGTTYGTPNTFVTTYSVNGGYSLRPLNPSDEFAHYVSDGSDNNPNAPSTAYDNIYLTTSDTAVMSGNMQINSLVLNGAGSGATPVLSIPDNTTLTNNADALLFVTSGGIQPANNSGANNGTFDFGGNPADITVLTGATATITSPVTGTGTSFTIAGGGTLLLNGNNEFSDGIQTTNTNVTFGDGWNPTSTDHTGLLAAVNSIVTFNGNSTFPAANGAATHMYLNNSTLNFLGGTTTFSNTSNDYLDLNSGNNSALNVGNQSGTTPASLIINDYAGMAVLGYGGVGYFNIYPGSTFTDTFSTATGVGGNALRFGADTPGAEIMNLYGTGNFFEILMGDNSGGSAVTGILGAIYLQPGSTFTDARTNTSGNNIFDIGSSGDGNATNGLTNNFGYVSVPYGTSIGSGAGSTNGEPGEIDIAGSSRGSPVGGGNGVMDVIGGTVNVYEILSLGLSTVNQQFAELNIANNGSTPGTVTIGTGGGGKSTIQMSVAANSGTAYGSYSVLNVVNSALNNQIGSSSDAYPNNAINLAGTTTYKGTSAMSTSANALQTGILNIVGSKSLVQTNYIQAGALSISSNGTTYNGQSSSFLNFNGGTLQYNNYSTSTSGQIGFIAQSVGGVYVYPNGAVLSGGVSGAATVAINSGFFAPPGGGLQGTSTSTPGITTLTAGNGLTSGGSGYLAPPIVYITDSTGFDASGYAVMNYTYNAAGDITGGSVASVVITNPGFNLTNPQITFVGGGGTGASATIPASDLVSNAPGGTTPAGGLTVQAGNVTFTFSGTFAGTNASTSAAYSFTQANGTLGVATSGSGLGNNPYASGTYYGNSYPAIKNNTSTYTGPTVIESGIFQLITSASSAVTEPTGSGLPTYAAGALAATNNNIPFSSVIVVGDTPTDTTAVLNISTVSGAGGFELAPGLINSINYGGPTYTYTSNPQVLAGFDTVKGSATVGLTVGLASGSATATSSGVTSTGNNFGGYSFASGPSGNNGVGVPNSNNSAVSPGYTSTGSIAPLTSNSGYYQSSNPYYGNYTVGGAPGGGPIVVGNNTAPGVAYIFNSALGNAPSSGSATGALAVTASGNHTLATSIASSTTTTFGGGGVYYWKLDLSAGGSGYTSTAGVATNSGATVSGAAWDALLLDNLTMGATASSSSPFTVQAVGINSASGGSNPVLIGASYNNSYSWAIAQVAFTGGSSGTAATASSLGSLLADFALNTSGMPAPASGYEYFLSAQQDPNNTSVADLVVNYAPVPEPAALSLLSMGAGALMLRRRRRQAVGAA